MEEQLASQPYSSTDSDFENIVDISPFPIMIQKMGVIKYANLLCVEMFGLTKAEELIGQNFLNFTIPEDRQKVIDTVTASERSSTARNTIVKARILTGKNEIVTTESKSSPIKFRGEDCRLVVAYNYDIISKYEQELEEKNLLLEKITELIPDSIAIVDGTSGEMLYENKSLLGILGYTEADLNGMPVIKFISTLIHNDDRPKLVQSSKFLLNKDNQGKYIAIEFRMLDKNGHWRWILSRSTNMRGGMGEAHSINFGIAQDITVLKEAEQQLSESRQIIEKVTNTIPDHISIFDIELSKAIFHNYYFGELLGYNESDKLSNMFDYFTPDYKETALELFSKVPVLKEGETLSTVGKYLHRNGSVKYLLSRITPFQLNDKGHVKQIITSTIDVTELKETELKLLRSEKLYKTIAENIPNGSVIAFDKDLRFTLAEGPLLQRQNFKKEEIIGKTAYDSAPGGVSWKYMIPYFQNVLKGKSYYLEVPDANYFYHILLKPLYDGEEIYGGINITLDVKEIKDTKTELTKSEDARKALLLGLPDMVFLMDFTGRVLDFYPNNQFKEIFESVDFVNKNAREVLPEKHYETVMRLLTEAIDTGQVQTYEHTYIEGDVKLFFEFRVVSISNTQVVVIVRDVTKLRIAQNELNDKLNELSVKNIELEKYITSNAELEKFAYIASHDLREPVRSIIGFAQLVQKRNENTISSESVEYLDNIISSGHRMYSLIHGLLEYSRISANEKVFKKHNLNNILKKVRADIQAAAYETEAEINIPELPEIYCDELQIRQLFQNLISNSIKFRRNDVKPVINISVTAKDGFWLFELQDNGIGIDMKYKEQVFHIFSRLHTVDKYSGSGIGLALCKKIIERHNGDIWLESVPGVGTRFFFTIPVNNI